MSPFPGATLLEEGPQPGFGATPILGPTPKSDPNESRAIIDAAYESGVRPADTARNLPAIQEFNKRKAEWKMRPGFDISAAPGVNFYAWADIWQTAKELPDNLAIGVVGLGASALEAIKKRMITLSSFYGMLFSRDALLHQYAALPTRTEGGGIDVDAITRAAEDSGRLTGLAVQKPEPLAFRHAIMPGAIAAEAFGIVTRTPDAMAKVLRNKQAQMVNFLPDAAFSEMPITAASRKIMQDGIPSMGAALAVAILSGSPGLGILTLAELSGGASFQTQLEAGGSILKAGVISELDAAAEAVGEMLVFPKVLKGVTSGMTFRQALVLMAENGTQEGATGFAQRFLEVTGLLTTQGISYQEAARTGLIEGVKAIPENFLVGAGTVGVTTAASSAGRAAVKALSSESKAAVHPEHIQTILDTWAEQQAAKEAAEAKAAAEAPAAAPKPAEPTVTPPGEVVAPAAVGKPAEENWAERFGATVRDILQIRPIEIAQRDFFQLEEISEDALNEFRQEGLTEEEIGQVQNYIDLVEEGQSLGFTDKFMQDAIRNVGLIQIGQEAVAETRAEQQIREAQKPPPVGGGVDVFSAVRNAIRVSTAARKTLVLPARKEILKQQFGAAEGVGRWLRKKRVPGLESIWRSMGQMAGERNPKIVFKPLADILEPRIIEDFENQLADTALLTRAEKFHMTQPDKTGAWDKLKAGHYLTPAEVRILEKWDAGMGRLAKQRISKAERAFTIFEQIAGLLKAKAGFDVQMRRQAILLQGQHPEVYTRAIAENLAAYISERHALALEAAVDNDPRHADAVDHEVRFLTTTASIEQYVSRLPEKIPGVGKTYTASIRGFVQGFNWTQQKLWNNQMDLWDAQAITPTEEMKRQLADKNNTLLAMVPAKTSFGRAARRFLSPFIWSPTMTWSRVRTPGMLLTNPAMRRQVAWTLSKFIGSGVMMLMAARMIRGWWGDEEDKDEIATMDPYSTDFLKVKVGNTRYEVYGDLGPYLRAAIQSIAGLKTGPGKRTRDVDWHKPLLQALKNKRAPWVNLISKMVTGKEYYGAPAWQVPEALEDRPIAKPAYQLTKEVYESFMPLFIEGTIEAGRTDGWLVAGTVMINEFFSGQSLSYEPTTNAKMQIRQDVTATATFGRVWDDLTPSQQQALRKLDPEIVKLEKAADDERAQWGPPEEISLKEQNEAAENVRRSLSKKVKKILKDTNTRITGISRKPGKFWLNNDRYEQLQIYTAEEVEKLIEKAMRASSWPRKTLEDKKQIIKDNIAFGKQIARDRVLIDIDKGRL